MYRGDAVVYNSNGSGHIMIYDSGNAWGTPVVWECKGCSYGCVHGTHSVSTSYIGIRRHNLQTQPTTGKLQGTVYVDQGSGSADMSERLPGATVSAGGKTATARDGDAYWSFDLNPGSYTVTASKSGHVTASRSCQVTEDAETWCSVGLVPACTPDCSGRQCGPDGCGESCGVCPAELICDAPSGSCLEIPAGKKKLYGLVVEKPGDAETDLHDAAAIERAAVAVDGVAQTETGKDGYYELLVDPGEHELSATAEGYGDGSTRCAVAERGSCECLLALEKTPRELDPD